MIHYSLISLHIFAQLFLLIFSAVGWAHWIWRLPKVRPLSGGRLFWVFLIAAGFCVGIVALQNLFYLGWRLRVTSWFAFGGAVLGNLGWLLAWRQDRTLAASMLRGTWQAGVVCLVVFLLQSVPLFFHGPSNYYGSAHTDQVNYVLVSQFIVDHPNAFHATRADPNLEPYSDIAMGFLHQRMGQSVGLGYLSVVSWGNTKSAYGVFSILALSFGAVAVYALLRTMAVPGGVAMLAGCWWALLPAITKMDLDGFLSQSWHAWTLPLSAALFNLHRRRLGTIYFVFQSIYFAFVMSFYPETFVVNVAFSTCLLVFASGASLARRVAATVVPPICGLLGVGWYLTLFINTLIIQYHTASGNVESLEVLVPLSGTLLGWSTTFFASGFASPLVERATIALSLVLLAIMAAGLLCVKRSRRQLLVCMCLVPIASLAALASAPVFPKYPFAKLLVTFTPFWVLFAVWGFYEIRFFLPRVWRGFWMLLAPATLIVAMAALALLDDVAQWKGVCQDTAGHLAAVDTALTRRCYKYAEMHKEATYIVTELHPILNAWLLYHCRGAKTYVLANSISDLPPTEYDKFRVLPDVVNKAVILSASGVVLTAQNPSPRVAVSNPQGSETNAEQTTFYWLGSAPAEITIYNMFAGEAATSWTFHAEVAAGPANPSLDREVSLFSEDGSEQSQSFHYYSVLAFPVVLHAGVNHLKLQAVHLPEQIVRVPGDPRNHMVYLRRVFVTPQNQ